MFSLCRRRDWLRRFFFFQAEDGIRDADVTGVQTCALPIFDGRVRDVRPPGLRRRALQRDPVPVGPEPPIEHELGLALLGRDRPDDVLVQSGRQRLRLDRRDEPVRIGSLRELFHLLRRPARPLLPRHNLPPPSRWRPFWSYLSLTQGFYLSNGRKSAAFYREGQGAARKQHTAGSFRE